MMSNLLLDEGSIIHVENISLPVATFAKFQPQSPDFLDITNPKAVYPFLWLFSELLIIMDVQDHFIPNEPDTRFCDRYSNLSDPLL